jgi:hypothetical protein
VIRLHPADETVTSFSNKEIMAKEIRTEIHIHATPSKIWQVLTDFSSYPQWNPFVKSLTGTVAVGQKIKVALPGMNFTPLVLSFEANRHFSWQGHLFFKGLFDGLHSFEIIDNKNGTSTFIHSEKFGGILVPLFNGMLEKDTKPGFEQMNQKLKARAEQ